MKVKEIKKALKLRKRKLPESSLRLGFLIRPIIIIVTSLLIAGTYYVGEEIPQFSLREGDISLRDIYAPFDFHYRVGLDQEKTKEARNQARANAGEVYYLEKTSASALIDKLNKIFSKLPSENNIEILSIPEELMALIPQGINFKDLLSLLSYEKDILFAEIQALLSEYYKNNYLMRDADLDRVKNSDTGYIYIKNNGDLMQLLPKDSHIVSLNKSRSVITAELRKKAKLKENDIILDLVSWNMDANLIFSKQETENLKNKAAENIGDIFIYREVKKHEKILSDGERIKKEDLIKIKEISQRHGNRKLPATVGIFLFSLLFFAIMTLSYKYFNAKFYQDINLLVLVSIVTLVIVITTKIIVLSPLPSYLIPVALGPMLIGMLVSFPIAIKVAIFVAVISGIMIGDNIVPAICFLIGGIAGTMAIKDIRKRSELLRAGIIVGGVQLFTVVSLGMVFGLDKSTFLEEGFISFFSGMFSAFFTMGLLPILEHCFKITTNIRLLEISDLNHPLLKELLIKAPGTYHHSLIVSSLAEQAAESIGANPLLARVGSYFHDIGKLEKPEYFTENYSQDKKDRSRHNKLSPSMSSLIIINHVKKGLELAQKYKLPPAIIDFIEQHHGMSLVYYFYHKALEVNSQEEIKDEQFRYPGPKPQTKEVAIVSLADAVEAATRSLQEPTSARIKGLIREIMNNKFAAGELDECELTFKDLNKIADVFTRLGVSIHHARIEYPAEKREI